MSKQIVSNDKPQMTVTTAVSNPMLSSKPSFTPAGAVGRTTGEESPGGKLTTDQFRKRLQAGTRNFEGCDLSGVTMCGLDLCQFKFTGANLTGADLRLIIAIGTDFVNANLSKCDLSGANLSQARLGGAKLVGANLTGAGLQNTEISGTDFDGANLAGSLRGPAELPRIPGWESPSGTLRKVVN